MLSNNNCMIEYFDNQNTYSYLPLLANIVCKYNCLICLIVTEIQDGSVLGGVGNRGLSPDYYII